MRPVAPSLNSFHQALLSGLLWGDSSPHTPPPHDPHLTPASRVGDAPLYPHILLPKGQGADFIPMYLSHLSD